MRQNYLFKYRRRGDKHVYVPTSECKRRGTYLNRFGATLALPDYFYHYRKGGHVDALHRHLENTHFFRIDLKNFFYSISRKSGKPRSSTIRFPKERSGLRGVVHSSQSLPRWAARYVLPIGFRQSPLLASLALYRSSVASCIEEALTRGVFVSFYFDDLIGSACDVKQLEVTYEGILDSCAQANFVANPTKLLKPAEAIVAFNCHLRHGYAAVTDERIETFDALPHSPESISSFIAYCERVAQRNLFARGAVMAAAF